MASAAPSGVSAIESVTMAISSEAVEDDRSPAAVAVVNRTKANSPPCGNRKAIWIASLWDEPQSRQSP
ncbi:hypothetical protein D3C87_1870080 [compost metagenome]